MISASATGLLSTVDDYLAFDQMMANRAKHGSVPYVDFAGRRSTNK